MKPLTIKVNVEVSGGDSEQRPYKAEAASMPVPGAKLDKTRILRLTRELMAGAISELELRAKP